MELMEALGIVRICDLSGYLEAEKQYLLSKYTETPQETMEMEYLEILLKLNKAV